MGGPKSTKGRSLLIGTVALACFAVAVYVGVNAHKGLPGAQLTTFSAAFEETGGLRAGDDARIARVRAGRVDNVEIKDGTAVATIALDGDRPIYRNATASVDSRSGLGQKIVNIDPGTPDAGELPEGSVLPQEQTTGSENLSELLAVFDDPTRAALTSTVTQTGQGVGGHGRDVQDVVRNAPQILPDLGTVSRALTDKDGQDLTRLLQAANSLSGRFAGRQDQIAALTGDLGTTLRSVSTDNSVPLRDTLDKAPDTLAAAREAMAALQPPLSDVDSATAKLQPGARGLGDATPDLRGVLREAVPPLDGVPNVSDQAQPALGELTRTMTDARPFAPRAANALADANPVLTTLSPYAPEVMLFFENFADAMSNGQAGKGDPNNRHLRVTLMLHTQSVDGQLGIRDPFVARNPYPAPGAAGQDSTGSLPLPSVGGNR
ncbi:MlaD family protein [Pseudonocardia endophytica]|uniref:Phospholipid/cholesterol/gamma-HCH transport system substrate-binding protein n=1 Tax=Pseudonocardia endophytica TaxID=401976 RepID=A0A4R1HXR4_PSEEN|nr:MlaD family protein [Pseudonocardia endophytica]TCK26281.1 phospholipid/cholesterol/gamma-HCH transport system substrate-binding protein [Pseudonocardia endophytica]